MLTTSLKRKALAVTTAAIAAVGLGTAVAPSASASTIPNGQIQICSQGNYSSFIHILPRDMGEWGSTGGLQSVNVPPGQCLIYNFNTWGGTNQVDVVGMRPDGSEFYLGSQWWNSSTGLGIGTQGSSNAPYVWTW